MEDRICYKSSTTRTLKDGKTVLVDAWKPWNEPEKARFRANGRKPELRRCVYSQAVFDDAQGLHREWQWKPIGPEIHEDEWETIEYVLTGRKEYRNEHEKAIDGLIQRMTSR